MRLNQNEEDLFNELEKIEFDFSLGDDINKLDKKEKEKIMKAIENKKTINNEADDVNKK